jgi:lipid-A-disaccharide synthase
VTAAPPRIAIVAGEPSGDLLGAELVRALRDRGLAGEVYGIGGPRMRAAGVSILEPLDPLAVRGYVEVLRNYRAIRAIRSRLLGRLLGDRPDLYIGVDAPDFNLGVEARLRRAGIATLQYVVPAIWAWRAHRVRLLARAADHVLALFPFEVPLLEAHGIGATYIGHPLADLTPEVPDQPAARAQLRLPPAAPVFALLPGSRIAELEQHAGLCIETAVRLRERVPEAQFLVPLATRETRECFERALHQHAGGGELPLQVLFGHAALAITAADVVLVASGTASLETALLRRPMVITYRMPDLSWRIMRRRGLLPFGGLPNILSGRFVVPELIQEQASADNLAQALANLYFDRGVRERIAGHFASLYRELRRGSAARAADAVERLLAARLPTATGRPALPAGRAGQTGHGR